MESDGYQKELFQFDDKPRKHFPRLGRILPKADFEGKIVFTFGLDRLVFVVIGVILVMVVVFAAGVERGRTMEIEALEELTVVAVAEPPASSAAPAPHNEAKPRESAAAAAPSATAPEPGKKTVDDVGAKPYTIVAATFRGPSSASRAAGELRQKKLPAYVTENPPYFVVCVGGYTSRPATERDFAATQKIYKDAYIKLR